MLCSPVLRSRQLCLEGALSRHKLSSQMHCMIVEPHASPRPRPRRAGLAPFRAEVPWSARHRAGESGTTASTANNAGTVAAGCEVSGRLSERASALQLPPHLHATAISEETKCLLDGTRNSEL